ncbi:baculoviral IAP repeat-containing protein 6-like [Planococcus citri]|uniref:baculoviral IAP repeat-containing protein 6-like n=1 Tax=Planococcus citri TaxID=170843 RepID=UPI0031F76825
MLIVDKTLSTFARIISFFYIFLQQCSIFHLLFCLNRKLNAEGMNRITRKREGEAAFPALTLLTSDNYVEDMPKMSIINSNEFTIGRALDNHFVIMRKCISRRHCSIHFDEETNKWNILSHVRTRKAVTVQGTDMQLGESVTLECGHQIHVTPFFLFNFICGQCEQCSKNKKMRLSTDLQKEAKEADSTDDPYADPVPSCSKKLDTINHDEEIRKSKETIAWQESRIKELEMKLKENEKREIAFQTLQEETALLEVEYKTVLERDKNREEDSRIKDELQAKITALEEELQSLKDDNANLINDICATVDDLAKMTDKCNNLEEQLKQKTAISLSSPSTSSTTFTPNVVTIPTKCNELLPTQPFEILKNLFKAAPTNSHDGIVLRRLAVDHGAIPLILECLAMFTHNSETNSTTTTSVNQNTNYTAVSSSSSSRKSKKSISRSSRQYWAKGTGYASGTTTTSWDFTQTLNKQRLEEERISLLLQILAYFVNSDPKILERPSDILEEVDNLNEDSTSADQPLLPIVFVELIEQSCLLPVLASYLRNDSVLDMAQHIPLYRAILVLLRVMSFSSQMVQFLLPDAEKSISIVDLLRGIESCVDTYSATLQKKGINLSCSEDQDLKDFVSDVRTTTRIVEIMTVKVISIINPQCGAPSASPSPHKPVSIEEIYLRIMKKLQFGTYDMISANPEFDGYDFNVSYHYERNARLDGDKNRPARTKRLAQETSTISTSLPLSYSSTVFVRCDTDRLDVMKVLIIGPAETPYANGCFEFDVYFPPSYPNVPMLINLRTTGRGSVRFNPNLYNDGKVCLSVLNTWTGRPEEKWNSQTSSFLQVLVSIQSLILVPDPYFNEPGFERTRGTSLGDQSSKMYNNNIMASTLQWAMIEQIRNPSQCFKEIIHAHFWLKRTEVISQVTDWIKQAPEISSMKSNLEILRGLIEDLKKPPGVGDNERGEFEASPEPEPIPSTSAAASGSRSSTTSWYKMIQSTTSGIFSSSK